MESTANCSFCNKSAILRLKATFVDAFGVIPDNSSTKFVLPVDYNQLQTVEDICKFVFKWLSIDSGKYELQITLDDYAVPSWAPSRMFAQNEEIMLRITSKGESLQLQRHSGRCNDLSQSQTTGNNFRHDSQAENRQRNTCTFKSVNGEPRNSDVKANMKVNGNANVEEHAASTKSRCSEVDSNEVAVANSAKSVEQKLTERLRARNAVFQSLAEIAKCGTESKVSPTSRKRKHTYFQNDEASVADVNDAPSTATIDVVNNGDASGDTSQAKKTTHQVEKSIRTNSSPISTECLGADVCITDHTVLSLDDDQEDAAKILQQREETKLKTALLANFGRKIKAPKTTSKAGAPLSSLSLDALTCQQLPCVNTAVSSPPVFLRQHPSGTILASAATAANSNDVNSLKRGGGKGLVHKSVIIQNVSLRSALPRCSQDTASIVEEKEGLECVLVNLHHGNNAVYTKARYPTAYASIKHPILQPNDIISFRTLELSAFAIPQISAWKWAKVKAFDTNTHTLEIERLGCFKNTSSDPNESGQSDRRYDLYSLKDVKFQKNATRDDSDETLVNWKDCVDIKLVLD